MPLLLRSAAIIVRSIGLRFYKSLDPIQGVALWAAAMEITKWVFGAGQTVRYRLVEAVSKILYSAVCFIRFVLYRVVCLVWLVLYHAVCLVWLVLHSSVCLFGWYCIVQSV